MSTQASADLIWRVVKGNNAFLRKQRFGRGREGEKLSAEPHNPLAKSSFKLSGVAHRGANLALNEGGEVVVSRLGKKSRTLPVKKAGKAGKLACKGRRDLRTALKAKAQRVRRLATRKTRKSWKAEQ